MGKRSSSWSNRIQRPLAGRSIAYDAVIPRHWMRGVLDGSRVHLAKGVIGVLYAFSAEYLKSQGTTRIGAGLSCPFLSEGVLRYKRKWGCSSLAVAVVGSFSACGGHLLRHGRS